MVRQEERQCNNCGYPVTYTVISDAHHPYSLKQFVAKILIGNLAGIPAVTDFCPKCNRELDLLSTRPAEDRKHSMRRD